MLCSKSAQLTRFIIVLIQTWDPVGVRRCVRYVYLERYCINKPALARRNMFLEAPVNGLCQKRVNRISCFFSLIWFPVLPSYGMTSTLLGFTSVKFHVSNVTSVFTQYLNDEIFHLYNIMFLSHWLHAEFVILFWRDFFFSLDRKHHWRCGEMQYTVFKLWRCEQA
jgi:hypothetical protein